ncbi:hypothetical protein [Methylocapsa sp. S129]|uniref:hypothetical protein n=1 Tax=Methylocapsa sp. S129 TaxID=1641869 RepID=UPI00131C0F86|nr:hypothetical protein [Methylocapsa sp. S129]
MEKRPPPRPLMLLLAIGFLVEAWVWQGCVALGRQIIALIPWTRLKARIAAFIALMPAPVALIIFLIPLAIVEPFKVVAIWLIAVGHPILGALGWIVMQFAGVGLVAVAFDLTRDKLLSMPWFVWVYEKFLAFHDYAHALVEPYKAAVLREMRALRDWARGYWARLNARQS